MRASERELSHGKVRVVKDSSSPGALAYTVRWKEKTALVVFNTSSHNLLLDNAATDLPAGTVLERVGGMNEGAEAALTWTVGAGGLVHGVLPPRSAVVFWAAQAEGV